MKHGSAQLLLVGTLLVAVIAVAGHSNDSTQARGSTLFGNYCLRCHGPNGAGNVNISHNPVWQRDPSALVRIIAFGSRGPAAGPRGYHRAMPPAPYNDDEIAQVAVYAMQAIGHRAVSLTADDVRRIRRQHLDSIQRRIKKDN